MAPRLRRLVVGERRFACPKYRLQMFGMSTPSDAVSNYIFAKAAIGRS